MPRSRSRSPRRRMRGFMGKSFDRRRSSGFRRRYSRSPKRRSRTHSPHRRSRSHSPRYRSRSRSPRRSSPPQRMSSPSHGRDADRMRKRNSPSPKRYAGGHISPKHFESPPKVIGQRSSVRDRPSDLSRRQDRSPSPHIQMNMREREMLQRNPKYSPPYQQESSDIYTRFGEVAPSRMSPEQQRSPPYRRRSPSPPYNQSSTSRVGTISSVTLVDTNRRRQLLSKRFSMMDRDIVEPVHIEDNITIGIHRSGPHLRQNSNVPIIRDFDPELFFMPRRKDEGQKPIFDREEILFFDPNMQHVYEERRTISVAPGDNYRRTTDLDNRRDTRLVHSSERPLEQKIRFNPKPDPRYEMLFKEMKYKEEEDYRRMEKVQKNPNDLRHNLLKRSFGSEEEEQKVMFDARKKIEAKRKDTGRHRSEHRSGDREQKRDIRDRSRSDGRDREGRRRSLDDRHRSGRKERDNLPDFKNRPDKYKFDKPESIPKNPNYYEHDVREEDQQFSTFRRGRGRFYRSRGSFRGTFRGRGGFRSRGRGRGYSSNFTRPRESNFLGRRDKADHGSGQWKHDLFDKLKTEEVSDSSSSKQEKQDDNKPTSTTKI